MSEDIPTVEDDQPEPEEELSPTHQEEEDVKDDEMPDPTGPKTSFVGDDQDLHGKEDHPQEL